MELKDYINILSRRKWIILITILVTLLVAFIGTRLQTPYYESSVTLRVSASSSGQLSYSSTSYVVQLLNTVAKISTSSQMLKELTERLQMPYTPEVTAEVIPNTELIKITVADPDPQTATIAAVAMGELLVSQGSTLYTGGGTDAESVLGTQVADAENDILKTRQDYAAILLLTPPAPAQADLIYQELLLKQRNYDALLSELQNSQYQNAMRANMITVIEQPLLPTEPARPQLFMNLLLGLVAGLLFGVILAFIIDSLDNRLYNTHDIERIAGMPVFSRVPKISKNLITLKVEDNSPVAETFRMLAMKLLQIVREPPLRSLLVLSAEPNQGKSMVVAHLGVSLAEFGKKVIAVDFDTHLPKLHQWLNLPNTTGIKNILEDNIELDLAIQETKFENLWALTSGPRFEKTTILLASREIQNLVNTLMDRYDIVLMDSPALMGVGDTELLSDFADGLILVARREETSRDATRIAGAFIHNLPEKFSALIVNQDISSEGYYYHRTKRREDESLLPFLLRRLQITNKRN